MKRRLWPFLTAALLVPPVLYVASFGPACWAVGRGFWKAEHAAFWFRPLVVLTVKGPDWVAGLVDRIAGMTESGGADGVTGIYNAAGYGVISAGGRVYPVDDLVIEPRGEGGVEAPVEAPDAASR